MEESWTLSKITVGAKLKQTWKLSYQIATFIYLTLKHLCSYKSAVQKIVVGTNIRSPLYVQGNFFRLCQPHFILSPAILTGSKT